MARTSLGLWKFVRERDMSSSSHWGLIMAPVQKANSDYLGKSFQFSTQWLYVMCTGVGDDGWRLVGRRCRFWRDNFLFARYLHYLNFAKFSWIFGVSSVWMTVTSLSRLPWKDIIISLKTFPVCTVLQLNRTVVRICACICSVLFFIYTISLA